MLCVSRRAGSAATTLMTGAGRPGMITSLSFRPVRVLIAGEGGVPLNEFLSAPADYWLDER